MLDYNVARVSSGFNTDDAHDLEADHAVNRQIREFASIFPKLPRDEQHRIIHLHRRPLVALTVLTNTKGLATKRFRLVGDELVKESCSQIWEGTFLRIEVRGVYGLITAIKDLDSTQACTYGTPIDLDSGRIVTQKAHNGAGDAIPRDSKHYRFTKGEPGILMLDYDPRKGHKPLSWEELDDILCSERILPELGRVERAWKPSASSFIYRKSDGKEFIGSGGWRMYVVVDDASKIKAIGELLYQRLWEAGYGHIQISKSGSLLDRSIIDATVWQAERLDFAAPPVMEGDLERRAPEAEIKPGLAMLATAGLPPAMEMSEWRRKSPELCEARGKDKPEAKEAKEVRKSYAKAQRAAWKSEGFDVDEAVIERAAEQHETYDGFVHVLERDFRVQAAEGTWHTIGELLDNAKKFHGKRFHDPLEPKFPDARIAIAYPNQRWPQIYSHIHGGAKYCLGYTPKLDDPETEEQPEAAPDEQPKDSGQKKGKTGGTEAKDQKTPGNKRRNGGGPEWYDLTEKGTPRQTSIANVKAALDFLGIHAWHNDFTCIPEIEGSAGRHVLDDHGVSEVWRRINALGFFATDSFVAKAWKAIAKDDKRHPIRDQLDRLAWDRIERLERLFIDYAGAPDTPYNRALGILLGVAMIRRIRQPGYKFDHVILLRGPQDIAKSLFWQTLASPAYFTDNFDFGLSSKEIIEQTARKWLVEVAELKGLTAKQIDHIRALITRQVDSARLAYAQGTAQDFPRQFLVVGTINEYAFLHDQHGNRRFVSDALAREWFLRILKRIVAATIIGPNILSYAAVDIHGSEAYACPLRQLYTSVYRYMPGTDQYQDQYILDTCQATDQAADLPLDRRM